MAYEHVLIKTVDIDVFINGNILGYVLMACLVNSIVYKLYKLVPFPAKVKNSEDTFMFIGSENDYTVMETLKKFMLNLVN